MAEFMDGRNIKNDWEKIQKYGPYICHRCGKHHRGYCSCRERHEEEVKFWETAFMEDWRWDVLVDNAKNQNIEVVYTKVQWLKMIEDMP